MPSAKQVYTFQIPEHAIDDYRPVKVICIGAGFSGVLAGIRFPQNVKNLNLVIYEKNSNLGGTWFENRYPGVACDIPSVAYQYTFESHSQWSEFYSSGEEIQQYLEMVAKKYQVEQYIRKRHMVLGATWDEQTSLWVVEVKNLETGTVFTDRADFLINATGILNAWSWPDIPGLRDFKGHLLHSADYDKSLDLTGKEVALIGGGSSGVQILPTIQPIVKRVDHYNRSKMWITGGGFAGEEAFKRNPTGGNSKYSAEELERFQKNPEEYLQYRAYVETLLNTMHTVTWADSDLAKMSLKLFTESMKEKLKKKPEVFDALLPEYPPICRRPTPGPGYLEAICQDNVEFISTVIKRICEEGIETVDGKLRKVDAIITATGFDTSYVPKFPVRGRNGVTLKELWEDYPEAYVSVYAEQMPNYMISLGPNGAPPSGSTVLAIEAQCEYMVKCVQKCQREGYKTMEIKRDALKAFSGYIDSYMPRTVFSRPCKSWFKRGQTEGRVVALYPGSAVAFRHMMENPRWEDFDFTPTDETVANSFGWLANGMTRGEMDKSDPTPYLATINFPPVPTVV